MIRRTLLTAAVALLPASAAWAQATAADGLAALRAFWQTAQSGQAGFTQVVTQPDGKKTKTSTGTLVFKRPGQFRFDYTKPYPQTIVCDGKALWLYDPDLNQATQRDAKEALGATPAALLVGGNLEGQFKLQALPAAQGMAWVEATPKAEGGPVKWVKIGFRGSELAAMELADSFGQRSVLTLNEVRLNTNPAASTFSFTPPKGVDVTGAK